MTKSILVPCLALLGLSAIADEQCVYRLDVYGNVRYGEPSYGVSGDGRIVEIDRHGNRRHDRPQYKVEGAKVYETDAYGRTRQKFQIKKD